MSRIYGPVPSRRLGRSLGIDLVPMKTCTYDCTYCQLGPTTDLAVERRCWFTPEEILVDLEKGLASRPDWITLGGSGEPTLHTGLDRIITGIRRLTSLPVAVITNGSLLWREDVRKELGEADLVIPSLDAGTPAAFQTVNRPHPSLDFDRVFEGLVAFAADFHGEFHLEVLLLEGITAAGDELARITERVKRITPDRVQLNTVTRPAVASAGRAVTPDRLAEIAPLFTPAAEVIASRPEKRTEGVGAVTRAQVLALLRRRPCTLEDLVLGLSLHRHEALKHLEELTRRRQVARREKQGCLWYSATEEGESRDQNP